MKGKKTGGRVAGTPNRVTPEAKEALANIVNGNAEKAQQMLDEIVDPKDWLYIYMKMAEFVIPKKAAVQVTAEGKRSDLKSELEEMTEIEI